MVLVPEHEMLQKLQLNAAPAESKEQVKTQFAIESALNDNTNYHPDLTAKYVTEMMHRLSELQKSQKPIAKFPVFEPLESGDETIHEEADNTDDDFSNKIEKITRYLPKTVQVRANQLLEFMKDGNNLGLEWNKRGELIVDGDIIPNSNVVDLLKVAVQPKTSATSRKPKPRGWTTFVSLIKSHNAPTALAPGIVQAASKRKQQTQTAEGSSYRTPRMTIKSKRKRNTGSSSTGSPSAGWLRLT